MSQTEDPASRIVNAAGFLFQLRVEHELKSRVILPGSIWHIVGVERRWVHSQSGTEGYIDLILDTGTFVLVIECKRVTDGLWVFLTAKGTAPMKRARLLWTHHKPGSKPVADWSDFTIHPPSPEAMFCVVRGHGETDSPMMERIASNLMHATEALAEEELRLHQVSDLPKTRAFIPLIVTNAELAVCHYDPASVDLSTGRIDGTSTETTALVRFRKSLSSGIPQRAPRHTLEETGHENQRTVLIMNSTSLTQVFKELEVPFTGSWPWSNV
jgi:hypothetical protein